MQELAFIKRYNYWHEQMLQIFEAQDATYEGPESDSTLNMKNVAKDMSP